MKIKKTISVFGSKTGIEEVMNAKECIESQWMGFGQKVEEFEVAFSNIRNISNFAMVDSGSNALFMATTLLDLPKGSEIIVPSFTWVACAQSVLLAGHKPVFCDVDLETQNITRAHIEPHITIHTKAIMVVHYAGKPVEMKEIQDLGLPIIEDAAHAVDSSYNGISCGSIGDVGIFSFDAVKNLAVGEGGGITSKNPDLINRGKFLRYCGIGKSGFNSAASADAHRWWEHNIVEPFIKMLPTNIAASIGLAQIIKLPSLQTYRRKIWETYQSEFCKEEWITTPTNALSNETHSYFTYFIRVPKRDELSKYLLNKKIYTTLRYHPLHLNKIYESDSKLINCELLNEQGLNIPLHPNLSEFEIEYIIDSIKSFKQFL